MSLLKQINQRAKTIVNTGFSNSNTNTGGRFVNKDGMPNVKKVGLGLLEGISWFHYLLRLNSLKFLALIFLFFVLVNLFFALLYLWIGVDHLGGLDATSALEKFGEAYFFSAQTFTTVGYGRINPTGFAASALASFEALVGLLSFAIATGLFYARFSKPKAFIKFSHNAILAPYKDGLAIMLRVSPFKNNVLTDAEAKMTVGLMIEENGKQLNRFFLMELEYAKVNALTLSWTIVHPINEDSPFYRFTQQDFENAKGEILIFVSAFDDIYSNTVVARASYTLDEMIMGAKFLPMYFRDEAEPDTILDISKINAHERVDISTRFN
jgi:inward rectifier potassium channel